MVLEAFSTLATARQQSSLGDSAEKIVSQTDWRNLDQGIVHEQDTSFVAEQTEVTEIVKGLKERSWPDVWYELVQGAFEYNDWDKGVPEIVVTYDDGESVPLSVFIHEWPQNHKKVARVVINNHIRGDSGLRPSNTYLTHHQEKAGETAFGKHGRGLKGALTAITSQNLAEKVTFESYASGVGSWFGQARMAADPIDQRAPDHYQVVYKTTQEEQLPLTTITVERPNDLLLIALRRLPQWFLPLNQDYQFSPLSEPLDSLQRRTLNKTTLRHFDPPELDLEFYSIEKAKYLDENLPLDARAEILSPALLSDSPEGLINWLYVDGWRVGSQDKLFANTYAFSGFKKSSDSSRKPERSNDSLWVNGDYDYLLTDLLYFTDDPEVFYRIFEYGWNNYKCAEWIEVYLNTDTLQSFPTTLEAIGKGWDLFAKKRNLPVLPYITNSDSEVKAATQKYNIPVLKVESSVWSQVLVATGRVKLLTVFLEEEAEKQKTAAENRLKELGILKEAVSTGEIVKVKRQPLEVGQQQRWLSEIAYVLANYEGSFSYGADGVFRLQLNQKAVEGTPHSIGQLNELGKLISYLYSLFGAVVSARVEVHQPQQAAYLNFNFNAMADNFGTHSLAIGQGKLVPDAAKKVEVALQLNTLNRDVTANDKKALQKFFTQIIQELRSICLPDGRINVEAYQASELSNYHPQAHLLLEMQRQRQKIALELEGHLAAVNAMREQAGLPLKTAADFLPKDQKVIIGTNTTQNRGQIVDELTEQRSGVGGLRNLFGRGRGKLFSNKEIDAPRTHEKTIDLGHPDERWGLASRGEQEALLKLNETKNWYERWQQRLRDAMEETLKALVNPDVSFEPGPGQFQLNRYLVHSIDSSFSSISINDYQPLPKLKQGRRPGVTALTFNKPDSNTGLVALPCPYGYQPIGYFTPDGSEVTFSGNQDRGLFAFRSPKGIGAGLTVYFEPISNFADTQLPDRYEKSVKVIEDDLLPHWQNLIAGLRNSGLTDKQKIDVLLRAWKRNQRYKKTQSTFDQYKGLSGLQLTTTVANIAEGNCGYMDLGFIGLVSTLMPSRSVKSLLFSGKGFDVNPSRHGLSQVFIDNRWVAIESQGFYVESGYEIEPVPEPERENIEALIDQVPASFASLPAGGLEAAPEDNLSTSLDRSRIVPSLAFATLLSSLKAAGINIESWLEKNQNISTQPDLSRDEMRKIMLQWGVASGAAIAATVILDKMSWKLANIMVNYRFAVEGTPAAEVFDTIHRSMDALDNTKLMSVLISLLVVTTWTGGYQFRAAQEESKLATAPEDAATKES